MNSSYAKVIVKLFKNKRLLTRNVLVEKSPFCIVILENNDIYNSDIWYWNLMTEKMIVRNAVCEDVIDAAFHYEFHNYYVVIDILNGPYDDNELYFKTKQKLKIRVLSSKKNFLLNKNHCKLL